MKQRLAIAATLLKDPQLLILDEPTNGLDPAGIREIRDTIRDLGESGVTVLLSSHILAEVQQVCSSVTIIGNGRMLASGKVDDLLGASTSYRVRVDRPGRAPYAGSRRPASRSSPTATSFRVETDRPPADITRILGESQVWLSELTPVRPDLETVFLDLTSGEALGETPSRRRERPMIRLLGARADPAPLAPRGRRPAGRLRPGHRRDLRRHGVEHPPGVRRRAAATPRSRSSASSSSRTCSAQIERCEKRPRPLRRAGHAARCAEPMGPQVEWYVSPRAAAGRRGVPESGLGVITILMGLLMLVGTTFAGADWNSGSMSNQLLFEPRRARVWLAKAAAVFAVAVTTSAVLLAGFGGGLALLAQSRDIDVPPEVPGWIAAERAAGPCC